MCAYTNVRGQNRNVQRLKIKPFLQLNNTLIGAIKVSVKWFLYALITVRATFVTT